MANKGEPRVILVPVTALALRGVFYCTGRRYEKISASGV